jgi:ribosome maturation factor RimP
VRKVHPVVQKIEPDLREVVEGLGFEYVLAKYGGPAGHPTLTVLADKPGGVTVEDCSLISRRLSVLLDMLEPISASYELVVSSPGIERPLVREEDYVRFSGQQARIKWTKQGGKEVIQGRLMGVRDDTVVVEAKGETKAVPLEEIEDAHLVYEWDE